MSQAPVETDILAHWQAAWPAALAVWSRFTRLQDPRLCRSQVEAAHEGLSSSFAMIRLIDQRVVIDLPAVEQLQLTGHALEILAHEIGHHVLAPATATDHARMLARIRRALPTLEAHAPMVANLYADLLINDRLQRQSGLRMADIYRRIAARDAGKEISPVWMLYMGIYEQLWQLAPGALGGPGGDDAAMRGDAWLGARLVRAYAGDWLDGAARFATLLLPHMVRLVQDTRVEALMDTLQAGQGSRPVGLDQIESDELEPVVHPALDPRVTGEEASPVPRVPEGEPAAAPASTSNAGQAREPFEYGEILRAAGLALDDHEIAMRYYRERALPHLVRFPVRPLPKAMEPQLEGLEPWQAGDAMDAIDWMQSVLQSPRVIPGLTTVQRTYGDAAGQDPATEPVDLDLYVDSSGSMPNPQTHTSYLALSGAIIALSALRVGARVQVTLWSGKHQVLHTEGFVRSQDAILRVLTGFFGGATAFPIHRLRDTYARRASHERAVHILHLSDDGITTMFAQDERANSGWDVAAQALRVGRAGGTMALNLYSPLPADLAAAAKVGWTADLLRAQASGWTIHVVRDMADLLAFARDFSRRHYDQSSHGAIA